MTFQLALVWDWCLAWPGALEPDLTTRTALIGFCCTHQAVSWELWSFNHWLFYLFQTTLIPRWFCPNLSSQMIIIIVLLVPFSWFSLFPMVRVFIIPLFPIISYSTLYIPNIHSNFSDHRINYSNYSNIFIIQIRLNYSGISGDCNYYKYFVLF